MTRPLRSGDRVATSAATLLAAAERNGYTVREYAEQYHIKASMERANAHLRRRFGTPSDLRDARICARLAGHYLARAHALTAAASDMCDQ